MNKTILVLDCGATNVRTIAVNEYGDLVAASSKPNNTQTDPYFQGGIIWDFEEIWGKLVSTTQEVMKSIDPKSIAGVTVTTFGVDCAPLDKDGNMIYPIISWACQRTAAIMDNIDKYIPIEKLYAISGVNKFSFNTINKLIWYKEQKPDVLEKTEKFAFISSLLLQKLSGNLVSERTMAGTSMLTDINSQGFSEEIIKAIGYEKNLFPNMADAGEIIGNVTTSCQSATGIPKGTPVLAAGHDTQFAIYGSGAQKNQPVLSSGTWEILMARTENVDTNSTMLNAGVTIELDAQKGLYTPGIQWLGSGVMEWVKNTFYAKEAIEMGSNSLYGKMIGDAEKLERSGLIFNPDIKKKKGGISCLGIDTKKEEIYLSALQSLAHKTKNSLNLLEQNCGFKASELICVGGGAKNRLWNKERAKALGIPVWVTQRKETTVLGAALFAMAGTGIYKSAGEARSSIDFDYDIIEAK